MEPPVTKIRLNRVNANAAVNLRSHPPADNFETMSWPAAVIFDFDGVIVNSEPLHFMAFRQVLHDQGIELTEEDYYGQLIGFDDLGAFKHVYAQHNLELSPKTQLKLMTRKGEMTMELIYRRQYQALPGVEELVRGLWRHYPLGICSGARRDEIEAMLEGVNLRDCFPTIVAAEDVSVGKPDPSGYLMAMELMGKKTHPLKPADCLVIEDAPTVVQTTREAGFVVLAVATSYPPEKLAHANYVVKTLRPDEVLGKIPKLKVGI
jgi:beta-phosphoglucomutase